MENPEVKPEVVVVEKDIFVQLMESFDSANELSKKLSIPVDPKIMALLKDILDKSPNALSSTFKAILSDGKIDSKDIPNLVLLISKLQNSEFPTISVDSLVSLVQFLIHALIDLEFVKVEDKAAVYEMVDVSLLLLKTTVGAGLVSTVSFRRCC